MPPRLSLTQKQLESPVVLDLLQLLQSVTADGRLTEAEMGALSEWLRTHTASEVPGIAHLAEVVQKVMADGRVTPEETAWVQRGIESILPLADRQEAAVRRREARAEEKRRTQEERSREREARQLARPIASLDFMAAGVFYENRQAAVSRLREGDQVILAREPDNPYSKNAILLLLPNGTNIGYVPERLAVEFAPVIDGGAGHETEVKLMLQGHRGTIPVVWGHLYRPGSPEGKPSPRVRFADQHRGEQLAQQAPQRAPVEAPHQGPERRVVPGPTSIVMPNKTTAWSWLGVILVLSAILTAVALVLTRSCG